MPRATHRTSGSAACVRAAAYYGESVKIADVHGTSLSRVFLALTPSEAKEMLDTLNQKLEDPSTHGHEHVSDHQWLQTGDNSDEREVTLCIYETRGVGRSGEGCGRADD
jgi:hypothetical protein